MAKYKTRPNSEEVAEEMVRRVGGSYDAEQLRKAYRSMLYKRQRPAKKGKR